MEGGDSFINGCVFCYWMCRSDLSDIPSRMCLFNYGFLPFHYEFLTFPCFWKISFSEKSDNKWNCHLVIGLRWDLQVVI